jgi:hypothetical protein
MVQPVVRAVEVLLMDLALVAAHRMPRIQDGLQLQMQVLDIHQVWAVAAVEVLVLHLVAHQRTAQSE